MTGKHADMGAWPSVPADRDLPPGRHNLHRENLMNYIDNQRAPAHAGQSVRAPALAGPAARGIGWRSRRRQLAAAAASATVAAGVVGYAISAHDAALPAGHVTASPTATLAAKVLRDAANQVARGTATSEPSPSQWIYTKTILAGFYDRHQTSDQEWVTFNGRQNAYYESKPDTVYYVKGKLVVHTADPNPPGPGVPPWTAWNEAPSPMTAYNVLASLPSNPQQLLAVVYAHLGQDGDAGLAGSAAAIKAQAEFNDLIDILWNVIGRPGGPPAAVAAVYRAFAALPGVSVQTGITDAVGAPAIGISDDGGYSQILLNPTGYQVIGLQSISTGVNPLVQQFDRSLQRIDKLPRPQRAEALKVLRHWAAKWPRAPWPHKGAVVSSSAIVEAAEVAAPGDV
jgi:hypothetical protein